MGSELKDTNPKDAVGIAKAPLSVVSGPVMAELGVAMFEGARKYGRHNWRVASVRASVYYDATFRHLVGWWEGQDTDPDSGVNHITKAIASLMVLRDAMIQDMWVDDRPPSSPEGWLKELNKKAAAVIEKYPDAVDPVTRETQESDASTIDFDVEIVNPKCSVSNCMIRTGGASRLCEYHAAK